ncbi:MAG: DegT/DnrJ/EryC1/StrS family aminotransferase [bacterium]
MNKNKICVTKPYLPDLEEFKPYLEKIWASGQLTNNGQYHQLFEKKLATYLGVPYVSLFANGTLALITALQAMRIKGEVITTPYSFVATTHALWWNRIKPVFSDIEPDYCTLDPEKIEAAITPDTTAILPVHVYGYPCQMERIQRIADKYGLNVIYDAAHTMGAKYRGKSIASLGDMSILSFHATKLFHTFEGGAIVSHDKETKERVDHLKNFGFESQTSVVMPGINAKMNEVQAAMGLLNLKYLDEIRNKSKILAKRYTNAFHETGLNVMPDMKGFANNYAYYPVFVRKQQYGMSRDALFETLKSNGIHARRYFYPLISDFAPYRYLNKGATLPQAKRKADEVICLPLYPDMSEAEQDKVIGIIKNWSV